jgi:L-iditol 2-dehydrogenase
MKTAQLTAIRTIEIRQVPPPAPPRAGEALLRVDVVGVCGSDMHYYRTGRIGSQVVRFPWIVGHECSCTVLEVGAGAARVRAGDRVAVDPLVWCGRCDQCLAGRRHTCRNQAFLGCPGQLPGSLAEQIAMPAESCYPVPAGMTMVQAALAEPYSIGLYAARLAEPWLSAGGACAAVLGTGPIGLSVLAAVRAHHPEAAQAATDIRPERLALAGRMTGCAMFDALLPDAPERLQAHYPLGADVVFECAGEQATIDLAARIVKPGGAIVLVGIPAADQITFSPELLRRREVRVLNVRRQNECVEAALDDIAQRRVRLDAMVTHEFPLERAAEAMSLVADYRDGVVKAMIHLS